MAETLKPLPTNYRGNFFRSRLEARFAVFMDSLQWSWEHEPEGFDLPFSGPYLPDFLVTAAPGTDFPTPFWVEVKPTNPSAQEVNKLRELACLSGRFAYFFVGTLTHHGVGPDSSPIPFPTPTFKRILGMNLAIDGSQLFDFPAVPHSTFSPLRPGPREAVDPDVHKAFCAELDALLFKSWSGPVNPFKWKLAAEAAMSARFNT